MVTTCSTGGPQHSPSGPRSPSPCWCGTSGSQVGGWAQGWGPHGSPPLSAVPLPGVAYTSECFPCKPGTFAAAAGSSSCQLCPANSFSSKGATACQPCEPTAYAGEKRRGDTAALHPGMLLLGPWGHPWVPPGDLTATTARRARLSILQDAPALH